MGKNSNVSDFWRNFLQERLKDVETKFGVVCLTLYKQQLMLEPKSVSSLELAQSLRQVLCEVPAHVIPFGAVSLPFSAILSNMPAMTPDGRQFVSLAKAERDQFRITGERIRSLSGLLCLSSFSLERAPFFPTEDQLNLVNGVFEHFAEVSIGARAAAGADSTSGGNFVCCVLCVVRVFVFFLFLFVLFFICSTALSTVTVTRPATVPRATVVQGDLTVHFVFCLHGLLWNFVIAMTLTHVWNFNGPLAQKGSSFASSPAWTKSLLQEGENIAITIRGVFTFTTAIEILDSEKTLQLAKTKSVFVAESRSAVERLRNLAVLKNFIGLCMLDENAENKLCFSQSLQV